jgi:hypothetical protein
MSTIAWMLGTGLVRKAAMDRRIPVLCLISIVFKLEAMVVENNLVWKG